MAHDRSMVPRHATPPAGVELDLRVKVGESSRHLGTPPSEQHHRLRKIEVGPRVSSIILLMSSSQFPRFNVFHLILSSIAFFSLQIEAVSSR